jgi:allantoinase
MRFALPQGFSHGDEFFEYLRDAFDVLYAEGAERPAMMMSIGMHCRLLGRPGRIRRCSASSTTSKARPRLG